MIISKAPVRVSFGGGGTDLPAYFREHGGAVLNATITKYTHAVLCDSDQPLIEIHSADYKLDYCYDAHDVARTTHVLDIPKTVLQRYNAPNGLYLSLKSDIPTGSGLGLSGAVTVNMINLLREYRAQACSRDEIAEEATLVEMDLLGRPIGLQDQYASAFGGLNFMEFSANGVSVSPVSLPDTVLRELEGSCMLFFLNRLRNSSAILAQMRDAVLGRDSASVDLMHRQKQTAYAMRDALQAGELRQFAELLDVSWNWKRRLTTSISNPDIDRCYAAARAAGALGGKIAGAGGGGFLLLYAEHDAQSDVRRSLAELGLHQELKLQFECKGVQTLMNQSGQTGAPLQSEGYLLGLETISRRLDQAAIHRIADEVYAAHRNRKKIFFMGNGGSAATASHASCDFSKTAMVDGKRPIRTMCLSDNIPAMTAWSNDVSFEDAFCGQLRHSLDPGDVVIGITGSGNSRNVVKALEYAKTNGALTIALVGFDGGEAKKVVDLALHVPSSSYQFIEDIHMIAVHLITLVLRGKLQADGGTNEQH
jgi:galactokinase/mevalonate kinase-like predicted kinase/phosphoheptose isomerase